MLAFYFASLVINGSVFTWQTKELGLQALIKASKDKFLKRLQMQTRVFQHSEMLVRNFCLPKGTAIIR